MNPYQLHPNPYSGPILLIVMTFLDLAAQMAHHFCKQLDFFLYARLKNRTYYAVAMSVRLSVRPSAFSGP